jgi:hypothetical protein
LIVLHGVVLGVGVLHFVLLHLILSESAHGRGQNTRKHQAAENLIHSVSLVRMGLRQQENPYLQAEMG